MTLLDDFVAFGSCCLGGRLDGVDFVVTDHLPAGAWMGYDRKGILTAMCLDGGASLTTGFVATVYCAADVFEAALKRWKPPA